MKIVVQLAIVALITNHKVSAINSIGEDSIWGSTLESLDSNSYLKDTPKAYAEAEKPKIDPRVLEA